MKIATLLTAVGFMAGTGLTLGLIIALANKFFAIEEDPRVEKTEDLLPGANCGGCGYAGCAAFAKALVAGGVEPGQCPVNSEEANSEISQLLGLELSFSEPHVALIKCCGDNVESPEKALYNGVNDCKSAVLVAGATKSCQHGCLGLASCSRACPFNAIEINDKGIALVHPDICVGCGKCVETCPRNLIELIPKSAEVHILCNSPEKAPLQRKSCTKGCIGCRKCIKEAGDDSVHMQGFLAVLDYKKKPPMSIIDVCPVKCIQPTLGVDYVPPPKKTAPSVKTLPCHTKLGIEGTVDKSMIKKAFAQKVAAVKAEAPIDKDALTDLTKAFKAANALADKFGGEKPTPSEVNNA
jgi:Na+-translocating ferredoxin:NAD+ oxidoreductase RNF subunit RnfB